MSEDIDMKALIEQAKRFNSKLDSFREHFEARFDQQSELIKAEFKSFSAQISTMKKK
ncbi:MAG: hypothetical protein QOI05_3384 [Bradyrhizobium sp.]|jgi:hypothetical protein|nr:hypothetical protein [Bradyrhizobium sp.]